MNRQKKARAAVVPNHSLRRASVEAPRPTGSTARGTKPTPAAPTRKLALARSVDARADGGAPDAARLWRAGWNETDKGALNFTPESLRLVLEDQARRGNPIVWYYNHEDTIPLHERGGAPFRGLPSASGSVLEGRGPADAPDLWARDIAWTDVAQKHIEARELIQISPIAEYDTETREIVAIRNVSLCAEGATHHGTLLASKEGQTTMDDMLEQLEELLEQGDIEGALALIGQMEGMEGGADMARMAKMMVGKMGKAPPAKPEVEPPPVVAKKMAATLTASREVPASAVEAFARATADAQAAAADARAAAKSSRRDTVHAMLSRASSDGLLDDGVTEREHLEAADPAATEKFLAGLRRMAKRGVLVAAKPEAGVAAPPKPDATKPGAKSGKPATAVETYGLSEIEMAQAAKSGTSFQAFADAKNAIERRGRRGQTPVGQA